MTYAQAFKGIASEEAERRMEVIEKLNLIWDAKQKCEDELKLKLFDKKIKKIRNSEAEWLKEIAWFMF